MLRIAKLTHRVAAWEKCEVFRHRSIRANAIPTLSRAARAAMLLAAFCVATAARAGPETFVIEQLYSNLDGSIQFAVLLEAQGANGGEAFAGRTLTTQSSAGARKSFRFPRDLPSASTAGKRVLIATNGFAALSILAPDYVVPDRFFPVPAGSVDFAEGANVLTYAALPTDGVNALVRSGPLTLVPAPNIAVNFAGQRASVPARAVTVVEFYNEGLDHYFMSPLAADIDALDTGFFTGWSRTGYDFEAFATAQAAGAGANPVCRFYIPPQHGDSHFFSASPQECAEVRAKVATDPNYSGYIEETSSAFYIAIPDPSTGACPPAALAPALNPTGVFRLWNGRADSNHRYATEPDVRAQMVARGYVAEGYGPLGVAMCTVNAKAGDSRVRVTGASPFPPGCDGVPPSSVRFTGTEVEPMVAVNPANPDHLIGAWQQDRWLDGGAAGLRNGVSFDGGRSWSLTQAPFSRCTGGNAGNGGDYARATDPWVTFGPDGTAFQSALAFTGGSLVAGSRNAILVSRSADGGVTWSAPTTLIQDGGDAFNDKESITADRYRPGHVYATWDRIVSSGGGPTYLARTTNNGASWEPARPIFDPGPQSQTINNQVVTLPDAVVNLFTQIDGAGNGIARLALVRSTDGGATWSAPIYIGPVQAIGTRDPELGTDIRDGAILGSFAAGANGQLAAVWQDASFSGGARDGVAFSRSGDGGLTWSPPVQVNSVPSVQALLPAVTIRDDGLFAVLYYDMRNNTSAPSLLTDVWLATSIDGLVWQETHVAGPFDYRNAPNVNGGLFIGDYQAIVSAGNTLYPFYAQAGAGAATGVDIFASAFRSIAAVPAQGAVKGYRAESAPALGPDPALRKRVHERTRQVLEWRRLGGAGATPESAQH